MDHQCLELYRRIQAFDLDASDAKWPFSQRLARENRWDVGFTRRVIEEYRKFAFLAIVAGHPVTPSDQVDQAWHLHLTYTRSYWEEFCPRVLGKPLHHEPCRGGSAERIKFNDWYGKTLASYERLFGQAPPYDIWPEPEIRFGRDSHFVRVNALRYWLLPRLELRWSSPAMALLFLLSFMIVGCTGSQGTFNPLDWDAQSFLGFFILAELLVILPVMAMRRAMRMPVGKDKPLELRLSIEELAYLAGGPNRAVDTALLSLIQRGCVELDENRKELSPVSYDEDLTSLEDAVFRSVHRHSTGIVNIHLGAKWATASLRARLESGGLWVPSGPSDKAQIYAMLIFLPLCALGIIRLLQGFHLGRPVGFLVILLIVLFVTGVYFCVSPLGRSRYGTRVLEHAQRDVDKSTDEGLRRAVAVLGLSALAGTALADLMPAMTPPRGGDVGCGGGDGGGGGDCGGDGCGCGGCGG